MARAEQHWPWVTRESRCNNEQERVCQHLVVTSLCLCVCVCVDGGGGDFSVKLSCCCRTILPVSHRSLLFSSSDVCFRRWWCVLFRALAVATQHSSCTEAIDGNHPSSAAASLAMRSCHLPPFQPFALPFVLTLKKCSSSWPPLTHRRLQIGRRVQA